MTHDEFSSKGGKAHRGTPFAKERARKAVAARWEKQRIMQEKLKELVNQLRDAQGIFAQELEPQTNMRAIVDAKTDDEMIAYVTDVPLETAKSLAPYCYTCQEWMQFLSLVTGETREPMHVKARQVLIDAGRDPSLIEVLKAKLNKD
jgi:hypothetical protein